MNYLGSSIRSKNVPVLDDKFIPFGVWMREVPQRASSPIAIAVEREDGLISVRGAPSAAPSSPRPTCATSSASSSSPCGRAASAVLPCAGCDDIAEKLAAAYSPRASAPSTSASSSFDAGGSDPGSPRWWTASPSTPRMVWFPKITEDPDYHYDGIVSAFKSAAEQMPGWMRWASPPLASMSITAP